MPQPASTRYALLVLATDSVETARTTIRQVERLGGRVVHVYPPHIVIGEISPEIETQVRAMANAGPLYRGRVELSEIEAFGPEAVQAVKSWNRRFAASFRALKSGRPNEGKSWGHPAHSPEGPVQAPPDALSQDEQPSPPRGARRAAAAPDTSAYLIGRVAVNLILVEGPAAPFTFEETERDTVVGEVQDGLDWLGNQEAKAGVTWYHEVRRIRLGLDPRTSPDWSEDTWRNPVLAELGYPATWQGLERFAQDRRTALGTDWAMVIFVTRYPLWHFAYAYKPRIVMNYDLDNWGEDDMDRIVAHETGHVFGAADEYAESKCTCDERAGYLEVENGNCENGAANPVACIMSHNTWAMCEYTRGQLGWRDSNGNGTLDPVDPKTPRPLVRPWWARFVDWVRRLVHHT